MAVDSAGNAHVLGAFCNGSITVGSTTVTGVNAVGHCNISVTKMRPDGTVMWVKVITGTGSQNWGEFVDVDTNGDVYVYGYFTGTSLTVGSIVLANQAAAGHDNAFLAKYDADGNVVWATIIGGSTTGPIGWAGISVNNGKLYLAGWLTGPGNSVTFGSTTLTSTSTYDMFVTRINTNDGSPMWANRYGSSIPTYWHASDVDGDGNLYVTGSFSAATLQFGTLPPLSNASTGTSDQFVAKFNQSGVPLWAVRGGGAGNEGIDEWGAISVSPSGLAIATTITSSTATFGSTTVSRADTRSIVVARLSLDGQYQSAFVAASGDVFPVSVHLDPSGSVYVGGFFSSTATFLGASRTSAGGTDVFIMNVSATNSLGWVHDFGNSAVTYVARIGLALGGGVILNFDNGGSGAVSVGSTTQQMNDLDSMIVHIPSSGTLP
jgi:hypothetical protein